MAVFGAVLRRSWATCYLVRAKDTHCRIGILAPSLAVHRASSYPPFLLIQHEREYHSNACRYCVGLVRIASRDGLHYRPRAIRMVQRSLWSIGRHPSLQGWHSISALRILTASRSPTWRSRRGASASSRCRASSGGSRIRRLGL